MGGGQWAGVVDGLSQPVLQNKHRSGGNCGMRALSGVGILNILERDHSCIEMVRCLDFLLNEDVLMAMRNSVHTVNFCWVKCGGVV
jgi:hypothetical protein